MSLAKKGPMYISNIPSSYDFVDFTLPTAPSTLTAKLSLMERSTLDGNDEGEAIKSQRDDFSDEVEDRSEGKQQGLQGSEAG